MQNEVTPVAWSDDALQLLDQRLLPRRCEWITCTTPAETAEAIRSMVVRGAPSIGVAAAYGMVLAAEPDGRAATAALETAAAILRESRPTAVNLDWAVTRMLRHAAREGTEKGGATRDSLLAEARRIHDEGLEANRRIGRHGAALLESDVTVLTHCNAGALATAGYGTALGVVRAAVESGRSVRVWADETRPFLQGARLTAWELANDGIDVTLITDGMAGHFFQRDTFDAVIVGADRIAANGDVANKIGTYQLAVLAAAHHVPFYVAAPVSTIDLATPDGAGIPIEERSHDEVGEAVGFDDDGLMRRIRVAPDRIAARHPAFDVTPAHLVSAIITEAGVVRAPYGDGLRDAVRSVAAERPES